MNQHGLVDSHDDMLVAFDFPPPCLLFGEITLHFVQRLFG